MLPNGRTGFVVLSLTTRQWKRLAKSYRHVAFDSRLWGSRSTASIPSTVNELSDSESRSLFGLVDRQSRKLPPASMPVGAHPTILPCNLLVYENKCFDDYWWPRLVGVYSCGTTGTCMRISHQWLQNCIKRQKTFESCHHLLLIMVALSASLLCTQSHKHAKGIVNFTSP